MMPGTYANPVYSEYFADPFVLFYQGEYFAYGTGPSGPDGKRFPVLRSRNLMHWEAAGWALQPLGGNDFWAPEVAFQEATFYMYYSAQGIEGRDHHLRVAVSESPLGPFLDAGRVLIPDQPFSIDAHPFMAPDGEWYLFYAQDFLTLDDPYRVGTGIVVDRLTDMLTLAGEPQVVIRPFADWHLFLSQRFMYGSIYDWHTVEGPAMRVHNGRYYCFYSGGGWERPNYGVTYVVADHPLGPYSPPDAEDAMLLRTVPDRVIGPGHNSFTQSPDGNEEWIVYHAWDTSMTARRLCIDRLVWKGDYPRTNGPTWSPQPGPSGT